MLVNGNIVCKRCNQNISWQSIIPNHVSDSSYNVMKLYKEKKIFENDYPNISSDGNVNIHGYCDCGNYLSFPHKAK